MTDWLWLGEMTMAVWWCDGSWFDRRWRRQCSAQMVFITLMTGLISVGRANWDCVTDFRDVWNRWYCRVLWLVRGWRRPCVLWPICTAAETVSGWEATKSQKCPKSVPVNDFSACWLCWQWKRGWRLTDALSSLLSGAAKNQCSLSFRVSSQRNKKIEWANVCGFTKYAIESCCEQLWRSILGFEKSHNHVDQIM
jgi:hypothetical protein